MQVFRFLEDEFLQKAFFSLPQLLYPKDSIRHIQKENINRQYLRKQYLIGDEGNYIGRAALYHNPHLLYQNQQAGCIGNYECQDNDSASSLLFNAIFEDLKKEDLRFILGPMNGSTWDEYRFNQNREIAPYFMEPFHHLYYNHQFIHAGFDPISWYTTGISSCAGFGDRLTAVQQKCDAIKIRIQPVNLDDFEKELEKLYVFCSKAFSNNYFYTPISEMSFKEKYRQAKPVIQPEFFQISYNENDEITGFIFCVEDVYNKEEKTLIIKTIARDADVKYKGLGTLLGDKIYSLADQQGYKKLIHAFMHIENASVKLSGKFFGDLANKYVLYGRRV